MDPKVIVPIQISETTIPDFPNLLFFNSIPPFQVKNESSIGKGNPKRFQINIRKTN
ncbi:hypothetical protein LEP1GSC041_2193 [Leptospira noguchii str. 2006001870]|nr:hypothetical protein LEP1GSC041_2193 [Leptospira noguchii str. 2006001870]